MKANFPKFLHKDDIVIALWKAEKMKQNINNKFNKKGFFMCKKIDDKYIFSKKHEGKREVYLDSYLNKFIQSNIT